MFESKYIDIKTLNQFFSADKYNKQFKKLYIDKQLLSFGDYKGGQNNKSIEPLFALVSDIQYQIKQAAASPVNWFEVQHIILSYINIYALILQ